MPRSHDHNGRLTGLESSAPTTSSITTIPILPLAARSNPFFAKVFEDALVVQYPPSQPPVPGAPQVKRQFNFSAVLSSNHDLFNYVTLPLLLGLNGGSPSRAPSPAPSCCSCLLVASPDCSRATSTTCNDAVATHQNILASVLHAALISPYEEQAGGHTVLHCSVFSTGPSANPRSSSAGSVLHDMLRDTPVAPSVTNPERLLEVRINTLEEAQDFASEVSGLLSARLKGLTGATGGSPRYASSVFHFGGAAHRPDPLSRASTALFIRIRLSNDDEGANEKELLLGDLGFHSEVLECTLLSLRQRAPTTPTTPPVVALSSVLQRHTDRRGPQTTIVISIPSFVSPRAEDLKGPAASLQFLHNTLFDNVPVSTANSSHINEPTTAPALATNPSSTGGASATTTGLRAQLLAELGGPMSTTPALDHRAEFSRYPRGLSVADVPGSVVGQSDAFQRTSPLEAQPQPKRAVATPLPSPTIQNLASTMPPSNNMLSNKPASFTGLVGTPHRAGGSAPTPSQRKPQPVQHRETRRPPASATKEPIDHSNDASSMLYNPPPELTRRSSMSASQLAAQQQKQQSEIDRLNQQLVHSVTNNDTLRIDYLALKRELVQTKEMLVDALGHLEESRFRNSPRHGVRVFEDGEEDEAAMGTIDMDTVSSISSSECEQDGGNGGLNRITISNDTLSAPHRSGRAKGHQTLMSGRGSGDALSNTNHSEAGNVKNTSDAERQRKEETFAVSELEGVVKALYARIAEMETTYDSDLDIMHSLRKENSALTKQNDVLKQRAATLNAEVAKLKKAETNRLRQNALDRIYTTAPTEKQTPPTRTTSTNASAASRASSVPSALRDDSKSQSPQQHNGGDEVGAVGATSLKAGLVSAQAAELASLRRRVAALESQNATLRRSVSNASQLDGTPSVAGSSDGVYSYPLTADPHSFDMVALEKEVQAQVSTMLDQHLTEKEQEITELRELLARNPRSSRGLDRFCGASESILKGLKSLSIQLDVIDRRRRAELLADFEKMEGAPLSREPEDAHRRKDLINKMKKDDVLLCVLQQREAIAALQKRIHGNLNAVPPPGFPEVIPTTSTGSDVETLEKNVSWELRRLKALLEEFLPQFRDACAAMDQLKTVA